MTSRDKGVRNERKVAAAFTAAGVPAKRGVGQARGGEEVEDIPVPFLHVEVKSRRTAPSSILFAALDQAEADLAKSKSGKLPCAVYLQNNKPAIVAMKLDHFAPMFARYVNDAKASVVAGAEGGAVAGAPDGVARALLSSLTDDELVTELRRRLARATPPHSRSNGSNEAGTGQPATGAPRPLTGA